MHDSSPGQDLIIQQVLCVMPGASFINKVPRTDLKSVLGHSWDMRKSVSSRRPKIVLRLKCAFHQKLPIFYYALVQGHKISCALSRASLL